MLLLTIFQKDKKDFHFYPCRLSLIRLVATFSIIFLSYSHFAFSNWRVALYLLHFVRIFFLNIVEKCVKIEVIVTWMTDFPANLFSVVESSANSR